MRNNKKGNIAHCTGKINCIWVKIHKIIVNVYAQAVIFLFNVFYYVRHRFSCHRTCTLVAVQRNVGANSVKFVCFLHKGKALVFRVKFRLGTLERIVSAEKAFCSRNKPDIGNIRPARRTVQVKVRKRFFKYKLSVQPVDFFHTFSRFENKAVFVERIFFERRLVNKKRI